MDSNASIHAYPCWNAHTNRWTNDFDPTTGFEGPIEIYAPMMDGTEDLDFDANFEVEFLGEYADLMTAIRDIPSCGRFMWSTPGDGKYLGFLNSARGSVAFVHH